MTTLSTLVVVARLREFDAAMPSAILAAVSRKYSFLLIVNTYKNYDVEFVIKPMFASAVRSDARAALPPRDPVTVCLP